MFGELYQTQFFKMKKILIFGGSEFQIPLIETAKKRGIQTCVLDINPNAPARSLADVFYECSVKEYEKALEIAEKFQPDGITAGMVDIAVLTVARICEKMGLPGLDIETAIRATDKYAMIRAFSSKNVPCPEYMLLNKNDDIDKVEVPWIPYIVKPIDMQGSRGINLVENSDQKSSLILKSISASDNGTVILEEYMVGPEYSVEMVVINYQPTVLQITEKITSGAPHFVELGHIQPAMLPDETKSKIIDVAEQAVRSIGIKNSIVHAEVIVTKNGPKMVELGARMGGDGIQQQLIKLSTGIDLPNFAIDLALGLPLKVPASTISKYSMIRFIPLTPGIIEDIVIDDSILDTPGLKAYKLYCKRGNVFEEKNDNSGRFGYVLSQAESYDNVIKNNNEAFDKIHIFIK